MSILLLAIAGMVMQAASPEARTPSDSTAVLRKAARAAEIRYERLVRRMAPVRLGGWDGSSCDEVVGRFCVRYDSPGDPLPPATVEPAEVTDARRSAIEALRRVFSRLPGEFEVAGPLVRYLVEDGRAGESTPVAAMYRAVSMDSVWGPLLVGFAQHADGLTEAAESAFGEALSRMADSERERFLRLDWLVEDRDRSAYARLGGAERHRFEARFWRLADPLYLLPGNEARAEHLARHVWSRILERGPVVTGTLSWGSDLDQLTVRYGTPFARTRVAGRIGSDDAIIDHFDPRQLAYSPRNLLTAGVPPTPLPGRPWEVARARTRSGFSVRAFRSVRYLSHQVSRFPEGDGSRLRVDGAFADSADGTHGRVRTGLWLLDEDGLPVRELRDSVDQRENTVRFFFETPVAPGRWVYALEAADPADSAALRARYTVDVDLASPGPRISDPVILEPFRGRDLPTTRSHPAFRPIADLTFTPADTIAVWVEAAALTPGGNTRLRLSLQPASRSNLPARILAWVGRLARLAPERPPAFIEWTATADPSGRVSFAFEIPSRDAAEGDYVLTARLTDLQSAAAAESSRILRLARNRS